jgi:hypothetical protein
MCGHRNTEKLVVRHHFAALEAISDFKLGHGASRIEDQRALTQSLHVDASELKTLNHPTQRVAGLHDDRFGSYLEALAVVLRCRLEEHLLLLLEERRHTSEAQANRVAHIQPPSVLCTKR